MFVQVIQGRCKDEAGLRSQVEKWQTELKPGADGWLGSTMGVAEDGTFIAAARFESQEAARRNSDRPEQGAWWEQTSKFLEDDVKFYDCTDVQEWSGGGSDDAGFVQVMQAYAKDKEAVKTGMKEMENAPSSRPDVIGGLVAWGPDDGYSNFVYFTSEEEARKGEAADNQSPEERQQMEEWMNMITDLRFIDLKQPWLFS